MARAVEIKIKDNGTFMYLKGISKRTKKILSTEVEKLAKYGAKKIRESTLTAGYKGRPLNWRGKLFNSIKDVKVSKNIYGIHIPIHGLYLDGMRTHVVWVKRGRLIYQWAKDKLPEPPLGGKMRVTGRPFIERGYAKMVNRANKVANKIGNKIVRG